jgi:hypothetical protein
MLQVARIASSLSQDDGAISRVEVVDIQEKRRVELHPAQFTWRTSVSSTSVTVITPGAGCSITSTATVSTTGAIGCFIRRASFRNFFTVARLGLALATVRFVAADFDTLRALPRVAEFLFGSFLRFCALDCFLRLAMISPRAGCCPVVLP